MSGLYHTAIDDITKPLTDKVVVLDLDQTLIATQDDMFSLHKLGILSDPRHMELRRRIYCIEIENLEKLGDNTKYEMWGVTRPYTEEFLTFCFSYFKKVTVWSAGKKPYVEAIVDHLFRDLPQPDMVFTHDDIDIGPQGHVEKDLRKMINSSERARQHLSLSNMLAIDDNHMTYCHNPANGVLIPPYSPNLNVGSMMRDDDALRQLKYWLLQPEVISAQDVSQLNTSVVFNYSSDEYKQRLT
jgi:hypothetical protein